MRESTHVKNPGDAWQGAPGPWSDWLESNMQQSTHRATDAYAAARHRIATGAWRVDPDEGLVYGEQRRPLGYLSNYGYVTLALTVDGRKRHVLAHRVIWEAMHGPIDPALEVNHRDGVKRNNRLSNLELVTTRENIQHAARNGLRTTLRGEAAAGAKITAQQVMEIRRRCAAGETRRALAAEYGLHPAYLGLVVRGKRWPQVPVAP